MTNVKNVDQALDALTRVNAVANGVARYIADQVLEGHDVTGFARQVYTKNLDEVRAAEDAYLAAVDAAAVAS